MNRSLKTMLTIQIKVNEDEYVKFQKQAARNGLTPSDEIRRQLNLDPMEE